MEENITEFVWCDVTIKDIFILVQQKLISTHFTHFDKFVGFDEAYTNLCTWYFTKLNGPIFGHLCEI